MARIIDLADILTALADADVIAVSDISANQDKKLTAGNLKLFILSGKTLGGSAAGDVTVNNASQVLSNKKLISPKVNSDTPSSATSEDLDKLHAVTVGATQINYLSGASSNIQSQLAGKANLTDMLTRPRFYTWTGTASGSNIEITEATIRSALGLGSDRRISERLMLQAYNTTSNPGTVLAQGASDIRITRGTSGALSSVTVNNTTSGNSYMIFIVCYDIGVGGGS